ncbi:hypothetical protein A1O7_01582 [Cladophialophora yegresii CBS 114405]|uniref:Uncharacterized protein n=1 Tax=Cladophialophora yegresii CBS 114405 TaxID=1182544 RepID=W9WKU5_9EURO|nr:uncharacterized protein A1O7_01582 [Cladophialophora yegresii CBS 114405]EXJ65241.1 hypothetical protein A1O7_01582 [Cladophialophora yegresii CBS 114405]
MPLYDVEHITLLTEEQQERLAEGFSDVHSTRIKTLEFLINGVGFGVERVVGVEGELVLRTVRVLGALTTAVDERSIAVPRVGEEERWLTSNVDEFHRLAAAGDENFFEVVHELCSTIR